MQGLMPIFLVVLTILALGHGHGHSHDEEPSFKYSRAANIVEDEILEEDIVDLPPSYYKEEEGHGHAHGGHGHSHGGHGHSHGGHGHSHGGHGHSHGPPQREPTPEERKKHRERLHKIWDDDEDDHHEKGKMDIWINALLSTLGISLAPFAILFFVTLDNSAQYQSRLKYFLSFASGGLLGDAFLHLIPHAIMANEGHGHSHGGHDHGHGHSHNHGHSHGGEGEHVHDLSVGIGVLAGILAFLFVEKMVRIYSGGHGHSHSGEDQASTEKKPKDSKKSKKEKDSDNEDDKEKEKSKGKDKGKEKKKEDSKVEENSSLKVAGYLNLFADCFHNFTDGLAIGASFLSGKSIGLVTTGTILFHEIPHEIGDYAILIQSGVSPFKAKCLQLLTAVGAFAGCLVALLSEGVSETATALILPFTAGGFIYIATVSVIPELLEGSTLKQSIIEILFLLLGVAFMVVITYFE